MTVPFVSRFIPSIYEDLVEPRNADINEARYISVLADSSTDTSVLDLEGISVRYLKHGNPVNKFMAVEELEHSHALGHMAAIDKVNQTITCS